MHIKGDRQGNGSLKLTGVENRVQRVEPLLLGDKVESSGGRLGRDTHHSFGQIRQPRRISGDQFCPPTHFHCVLIEGGMTPLAGRHQSIAEA